MDDTKRSGPQGMQNQNQNQNEGEGSKTADKKYRDGATSFAKRTDTLQTALKGDKEVQSYRDEFDAAEKAGRSHSAGDLPQDLDKK